MAYQEIINYIRRAKQSGLSDKVISSNLLDAGWHQIDIDGAFGVINSFTSVKDKDSVQVLVPKTRNHIKGGLFILFIVFAAVMEGFILYTNHDELKELKDYSLRYVTQYLSHR